MKKKNLVIGSCVAGAGILATAIATSGAICYKIACVSVREKPPETDPKRIFRTEIRKKNNAFLFDHKPEDLEILTEKNMRLKAWFVPSEKESKKFIICVHGHKCNGPDECGHLFPFYHYDMGYNYLLPDLRGHGRSDGNLIGFGTWDCLDIKRWIDYLIDRFGEDIEIALHGISMGAATVMLVNNTSPRKQVKAIIEDCGFTNALDEIIFHSKSMGVNRLAKPVANVANIYCKLISKYDLKKDANPLDTMKNAKNPVLFVHGEKDMLVPFEMCGQLYDACPTPKDIFTVPDAEHAYCYYDAKEEYEEKVKEFLGKYM